MLIDFHFKSSFKAKLAANEDLGAVEQCCC